MDLGGDLAVIHEPTRLRIMTMLYRETDLAFTTLRDGLGLTPGNLGSHLKRLEDDGLVEARDALGRQGFEKRVAITALGVERFSLYLERLQAFIGEQQAVPPPAPAGAGKARRAVTRAALSVGGLFVVGEGLQQVLSDASGSTYAAIAASGALLGVFAVLGRFGPQG